jgi:hypothetical protein
MLVEKYICDMCIVDYICMSMIMYEVILYIYQNGLTPFLHFLKNGNYEMCKLLIDNGALPSINIHNNVNT